MSARGPGLAALLFLIVACNGGGGRAAPISGSGLPPELVYCRSQIGKEEAATDVFAATTFGLNAKNLGSRAGVELGARISPDKRRVAFVRERKAGDPTTRDLIVAMVDNSAEELRLTNDLFRDDSPCWAPDGQSLLFASTRAGASSLWRIQADGSNLRQVTGGEDYDPDWIAAGDLVVFTRVDRTQPQPRARLMLMAGNGSGERVLSTGGAGTSLTTVPGDFEGALSKDGKNALCSRVLADGVRKLMRIELATKVETFVGDGLGEDRWPRWAPAGDRIFCAQSRPLAGQPGLRLAVLGSDGKDAALLFPDKRYHYPGFDLMPDLGAYVPPTTTQDLDIAKAVLTLGAGVPSGGTRRQIEVKDGLTYRLASQTFDSREISALRLLLGLGAPKPDAVRRVQVEVTASLSRVDPDSYFRISIRNATASRHDTVVEQSPGGTGLATWSFTLASLAHVDRDTQIELEIIGDWSPGARAELAIDAVRVTASY